MEFSKYSFIIFKEDALKNQNIMKCVHNEIAKQNLAIETSFIVNLNEEQVDYMWHQKVYDFVSNYLIKKYMTSQPLLVYVFNDEEAINKTALIKKEVRRLYQRSRYANCIHAPSSEEECKSQYLCLEGKYSNATLMKPSLSVLIKFSELHIDRLKECAEHIYTEILDMNFKTKYDDFIVNSKKFYLLWEWDYNYTLLWFNEIISILYESFRKYCYSIEDVYFIAFGAEQLGSYPVFCCDNYEEILIMHQNLRLKGLTIDLRCKKC